MNQTLKTNQGQQPYPNWIKRYSGFMSRIGYYKRAQQKHYYSVQ